jgi:hypothetical protein
MACPHTTGIVAQLYQKQLQTYALEEAISCTSSVNQLNLDPFDTISRNMLLHIPDSNSAFTCDLGSGMIYM